ncbi:MAG TPA: hypothetical protein VMH35_07735 [Streptosporangiaceae bacterium]|nr:hypothetical protein [Streptosporangiaceae bacterium]
MSLPVSQQRALDAIDHELRGADRRLAGMFRVFSELTRLEKMPPAETYQPARWWAGAGRRTGRRPRSCTLRGCCRRAPRAVGTIVLVPLLLAATLSLLLLGVLTTGPAGRGRCAPVASFVAPARLSAPGGCAAGGPAHTGPAGG